MYGPIKGNSSDKRPHVKEAMEVCNKYPVTRDGDNTHTLYNIEPSAHALVTWKKAINTEG